MVNRISIAVAILVLSTAPGAGAEAIEAPIDNVTVYSQQARVERVGELDLKEGQHSLVIENLPVKVDDRSIRVTVKGLSGVTILRMKPKQVMSHEGIRKNDDSLRHRIEELESTERRSLQDHLGTFKTQKLFLNRIAAESSELMSEEVTLGAMNVGSWESAYRFVGARMMETDDSIRVTELEIERVNLEVRRLQEKLKVQGGVKKTSKSVTIDLDLKQAGELRLGLSYVINGASWIPLYDARLTNSGDSLHLSYMAEVQQSTGESWEDVTLTLSTASPESGAGPGDLMPKYLSVLTPRADEYLPNLGTTIAVRGKRDILDKFVTDSRVTIGQQSIKTRPVQTVDALMDQVSGVMTTTEGEVFMRGGRAGEINRFVRGFPTPDEQPAHIAGAIVKSALNAEFLIKRKETVHSNNEQIRVSVAAWTLPVELDNFCRPMLRKAVYRIGHLINQQEAPLLRGEVSLFAGVDYLGKLNLDKIIAPGEKFDLPFGADPRLTVKREVIKFQETKRGNRIRLNREIKITLSNHSESQRQVKVEDLIPVSRDSRVKIKTEDIQPKPSTMADDGQVEWELNMPPGETVEIVVPYSIEYRAGTRVLGL